MSWRAISQYALCDVAGNISHWQAPHPRPPRRRPRSCRRTGTMSVLGPVMGVLEEKHSTDVKSNKIPAHLYAHSPLDEACSGLVRIFDRKDPPTCRWLGLGVSITWRRTRGPTAAMKSCRLARSPPPPPPPPPPPRLAPLRPPPPPRPPP